MSMKNFPEGRVKGVCACMGYVPKYHELAQGQIQDFLIGGENLQ